MRGEAWTFATTACDGRARIEPVAGGGGPRSRLGLVEAGDGFHEGQKVWVIVRDGSQGPAIYVGEGENASWFGGQPLAYVVFADDAPAPKFSWTRSSPETSKRRTPVRT